MSYVQLVVRESERDWSGHVHGSDADRAIAALSADPVTLEELETAVERFHNSKVGHKLFSFLRPGIQDEPYDAGLVVIDLIARYVMVSSTYSSPSKSGHLNYHDGNSLTDIRIPYHLADDWEFDYKAVEWRGKADCRRRDRAAKPLRDVRAVFYGKPLLEFFARRLFEAFPKREEIKAAAIARWREERREWIARKEHLSPENVDPSQLTDEEVVPNVHPGNEEYADPFRDLIRQTHADWLLTPRDDLDGRSPRDVYWERHDHLGRDAGDRCAAWSYLESCPPGLNESSHAYKYGGFGTHELVMYYELVRELAWSCWERLTELSQSANLNQRPESLTVGDFLTTEVPRLEQVRECWLDSPDEEMHCRSPRSIIHRERLRLPEGLGGHEMIVDPDCPCCQMMAELPGVGFWHLDGCNMDDDFAFDIYHRTREEWEAEQREYEEFSRQCDAREAERNRLGLERSYDNDDEKSNIWSRSFDVEQTADVPLGVRIFGIGCRLAELIVDLRGGAERENLPPESQRLIDQLNRDFGNLREILQRTEPSLAESLFAPVTDRFRETLASVAGEHPQTERKCDALCDDLAKLLAPSPPEPEWDSTSSDDEFPF